MFKDFLAKLGANTKITVGVAISPGVGLEMAEVDVHTKTVTKYGFKPLEYNFSSREVVDYDAFQEALNSLFDELHISKRCNVILTVPTVHFGTINLPLLLTDEAITNAIVSEVEQSYIFKRQDPVVSWIEITSNIDTENRQLAYTAIQQSAIDGFEAACDEVGCHISAIEVSCCSLMKALSYMEYTDKQMKENITWNLMVINQNSYSIFSMVGKKVIEYYEEPLALKSFVDDEIYNAITTSAQLTLSSLPANYLYIVSETDLVSSEILSMKIQFEGQINFLESNKYSQNEIMTVNLDIIQSTALKITPEIIGSTIYQTYPYPIRFNFIKSAEGEAEAEMISGEVTYPKINIGNTEVEITPLLLKKLSIIVGLVVVLPLILLIFLLNPIISKEQAKLDGITQKITSDNEQIKKYKSGQSTFDPEEETKKITKANRTQLLDFGALGISIPNKLWITYYDSNSNGNIDIKGKASDVDSIYIFYKNMKQLVDNSNIRIHKLELETSSVDSIVSATLSGNSRYFVFEITNLPDGTTAGASTPTAGQPTTPGAATNPAQPGVAPAGSSQPAPSQPAQPQQQAPAQPTTPAQPTSGSNTGLPPNLQKIEKF